MTLDPDSEAGIREAVRQETTMRFMMLMIPKGYENAAPGATPDPKAVEGMMKYNEELQKAGVLLALDGLHPPSEAARVTLVGGYWIIQVRSRDEAIQWATRCPAGANETIEVRQVFEMSEFPPEVQQAVGDFKL